MAGQSFEVVPIAQVVGGRIEPTDDYWGGTRSIIRIDSNRFDADATAGLDSFSHLEIVYRFHLTDPTDLNLGARRARDNPDWPAVGICTPVLDIKPWFHEFGPRGPVRQAAWSTEMLTEYFATPPHRHTTHEPQTTRVEGQFPMPLS